MIQSAVDVIMSLSGKYEWKRRHSLGARREESGIADMADRIGDKSRCSLRIRGHGSIHYDQKDQAIIDRNGMVRISVIAPSNSVWLDTLVLIRNKS